jgi:hypothetical protein
MTRPPCWPVGQPCPNPCAAAHYDRTVYNRTALAGPWDGWRLADRFLISPDGDRITPERLRGLLWRQAADARINGARNRREARRRPLVKILRVEQPDPHRNALGSSAG